MELVAILRTLQSNDNAVRGAAEQRFEESKRSQPAATIASLFHILAETHLEEHVREQACVLLRQVLPSVYDVETLRQSKLDEGARADVKAKLLQLLENELQVKVRRRISDVVQFLGKLLIAIPADEKPQNDSNWPELIPCLIRIITDARQHGEIRADALWVLKELTASIWPVLLCNAEKTMEIIKLCLADACEVVRSNAASLLCGLMEQVLKRDDRNPFTRLVPDLAAALRSLSGGADPTHLNTVLQSMMMTAETADFFNDFMAHALMPALCTIAHSHSHDDSRRLALEVIVSFAEKKPKSAVNIPGYLQQTLDICVCFIMELGDDLHGWAAKDDEGTEEEEQFVHGKDVLDRFCRKLHKVGQFPLVMGAVQPIMAQLFQTPEWKQVVAGMTVLPQIAEYVDEESVVEQMLSAVKTQLRASHPRVRYAAWAAIGQLAMDHAEIITSEVWVQQLLPEFLEGLDDSCQRTLFRCMEAFQIFGEALERDDLEPFAHRLMEKVGQKLQGPLAVQKPAIAFIGVIAGQIGDAFALFYPAMMPLLKTVVQTYLHRTEERAILGKVFECISLLAESVGTKVFIGDAEIIMHAMMQAVQVPNLPLNDPASEYMMSASRRFCKTLKGKFVPFVPHILPMILVTCNLAPLEYKGDNAGYVDGEMNLALLQERGGMKVMMMRNSEMEDLQNAIAAICTFAEELGKLYAPFVVQTAYALLPVFDFPMGEGVRDIAFDTWGQLCKVARDSEQVAVLAELCQEFMKRILPRLAATETDRDALKTRADGLATCLKNSGPNILSEEEVGNIVELVTKLLVQSLERRRQDENIIRASFECDTEDAEDGESEYPLRLALTEVSGALMQHHPESFMMQGLPTYLLILQKLSDQTGKTKDQELSLSMACDLLENLGDRITPHWPRFLPALLRGLADPLAELRQPACYGVSLAARNPAFASLAAETAAQLAEVVTQVRARGKKKSDSLIQSCADNALSALVEILLHQQDSVVSAETQLWAVWLYGLPVQVDEQEGLKNHRILLNMLKSEKSEVVGVGAANLPKIMAVLVDVYQTGMADDGLSKGIGEFVLKMQKAVLEQLAKRFTDKQRKKILRIHREAEARSV